MLLNSVDLNDFFLLVLEKKMVDKRRPFFKWIYVFAYSTSICSFFSISQIKSNHNQQDNVVSS